MIFLNAVASPLHLEWSFQPHQQEKQRIERLQHTTAPI